jgi:hypothetical protein
MRVVLLFLLVLTFSLVVCGQDIKVRDSDYASRRDSDSRNPPSPEPQQATSSKRIFAMLEARLAFANNDALRKVKEVTWECILISPDTNTEISRYLIKSHQKIAAKEGAILKKRVPVPLRAVQRKVVNVAPSGKKDDEYEQLRHAVQQNRILEIKYTDGSSEHP